MQGGRRDGTARQPYAAHTGLVFTGGPGGFAGRDDDSDAAAPLDVRAPDDLAELDEEVRAYRRELARRRRRAWWRSRVLTRRWRQYGLSGPLVGGILVVVALVGSLMALLAPRFTASPPPRPLARPSADVGEAGGLLPDVSLSVRGSARAARDLRPAVLAVVPESCRCEPAVVELIGQAQEYRLPIYLLGPPSAGTRLGDLSRRITGGTASVTIDADGGLLPVLRPTGLTAVLVHGDGVLEPVQRDLETGMRLEIAMAGLGAPGATQAAPLPPGPSASGAR